MKYILMSLTLAAFAFAADAAAQDADQAKKADAPQQETAPQKETKSESSDDFDLDAYFKKGEDQVKDGQHCGPNPKETPVA